MFILLELDATVIAVHSLQDFNRLVFLILIIRSFHWYIHQVLTTQDTPMTLHPRYIPYPPKLHFIRCNHPCARDLAHAVLMNPLWSSFLEVQHMLIQDNHPDKCPEEKPNIRRSKTQPCRANWENLIRSQLERLAKISRYKPISADYCALIDHLVAPSLASLLYLDIIFLWAYIETYLIYLPFICFLWIPHHLLHILIAQIQYWVLWLLGFTWLKYIASAYEHQMFQCTQKCDCQ